MESLSLPRSQRTNAEDEVGLPQVLGDFPLKDEEVYPVVQRFVEAPPSAPSMGSDCAPGSDARG